VKRVKNDSAVRRRSARSAAEQPSDVKAGGPKWRLVSANLVRVLRLLAKLPRRSRHRRPNVPLDEPSWAPQPPEFLESQTVQEEQAVAQLPFREQAEPGSSAFSAGGDDVALAGEAVLEDESQAPALPTVESSRSQEQGERSAVTTFGQSETGLDSGTSISELPIPVLPPRWPSESEGAQLRPVPAAHRISDWNRSLLDELLAPKVDGGAGSEVLLACDDETVRVVGERLGYDGAEAVIRLAEDARTAYEITARSGLLKVAQLGGDFEKRPRPRPLPEHFAALCLLVVAASRMGPDATNATAAYYPRLRRLLGLPGEDRLPSFEYVPQLFRQLAEWLAEDLSGSRGHLILPDEFFPPYVGACVSQTVFRERDRQVLSEFFSERMQGSIEGFDPLRLLRRWPGRHELTRHALELVEDETVAERVRAAINAAFRSWDGARLVGAERGESGRYWPAFVRLLVYPEPHLQLGAAHAKPLELPFGDSVLTLEPGRELPLPWPLLARAHTESIELGNPRVAGGALRVPRLGDTIIFERSEDGLLRVERPAMETVWLLTRDADLQDKLTQYRFHDGDTLPERWALFYDTPLRELPDVERAPASAEQAPLRIEGGLPLGRPRYLSDYAPVPAAGDLETDERLRVTINGAPFQSIASGERLTLPSKAGRYDLVVGDGDFRTSFDVEDRGQPVEVVLSHQLGSERALRSGASPAQGDSKAGLIVRGATVSVPYRGRLPILTRVGCDLETIDCRGNLMRHPHQPTPSWLAEVGLDEHGRWEVFCEDPVWLLQQRGPTGRPWARLLTDRELSNLSFEAARRVVELAPDVSVTGRRVKQSAVVRHWQRLIALAHSAIGGDESGANE
jgi:hypothetical protein